MQILVEFGIDWREGKLTSKLYKNQCVKVRLDPAETRSMKIRQVGYFSPILFNLHNEYLTKEALEVCKDLKIGQVLQTLKYADDNVVLAEAETKLQGMTEMKIYVKIF
jgi:hypothetical protein